MNSGHIVLLLFGAGMIFKSISAIKQRSDLQLWLFSLLGGVILAARIYKNSSTNLEQFILTALLAFGFCVTLFLYKNTLPRIQEHSLLILTLIFLYCFFKNILFVYPGADLIFVLLSIPSIALIYFSFVNIKLPPFAKLFFYIWFIFINLFFIFFYLFSDDIYLWNYLSLASMSPLSALSIGYTAFTLMANLCYIYMLVLPGDKHDTWQTRMNKWKAYTRLLISKHDDSQLHFYQSVLILIIAGGGLIINYFFDIASDQIIIPLYLFGSQFYIPTNATIMTNDHRS